VLPCLCVNATLTPVSHVVPYRYNSILLNYVPFFFFEAELSVRIGVILYCIASTVYIFLLFNFVPQSVLSFAAIPDFSILSQAKIEQSIIYYHSCFSSVTFLHR
jgi:hypothetical protein